jgi:hypothetical protein
MALSFAVKRIEDAPRFYKGELAHHRVDLYITFVLGSYTGFSILLPSLLSGDTTKLMPPGVALVPPGLQAPVSLNLQS